MNIVILSPGMAHDGNTLKERSLGGSETAAIQLAEAIAKRTDAYGRENRVIVFSPCEQQVNVNNVLYMPIGASQQFCEGSDIDLLIVSRAIDFLKTPMWAKCVMLWCHDLGLKRYEQSLRGIIYQVDQVLVMSDFQKKQYMDVYGLPEHSLCEIRNGIDLEWFKEKNTAPEDRHKGLMVYAARPERGLENLVRPGGVMDELLETHPQIKLMVAHYDNTTKEMAPYYNMLWARASSMSNVKLVGSLTKQKLYDLYRQAWLYIYPTPAPISPTFDEISCISAMEAAACGLPFLTTTRGALVETVKDSAGIKIQGDGFDEVVQRLFVSEVKNLFEDDKKWLELSEGAHEHGKSLSWDGVAKQILAKTVDIIREKSSDPASLYKHFYRMSDIEMCRALESQILDAPEEVGRRFNSLTERERQSVASGWRFTASPDLYREHYINVDKGASVNHFMGSEDEPRWIVLKNFILQNKGQFRRVLDYGCWIGHQSIRVANLLQEAEVVGLDITQRNIDLANECKEKYSTGGNVRFHKYDEMDEQNPNLLLGNFDLVLLNEVLEHVLDPHEVLRRAEKWCKPGGTIFITTPYGPWEYQSYKTFPYRCHLRHYEMADLIDIFGKKSNVSVFYKAISKDDFGYPLGHHYVTYTNDKEAPTGRVNVGRKMQMQAPKQTVSVCMIAHNAESMLHRTLKSVEKIADEIIVAIDPKTTDTTDVIAKQYGAKVIEGNNPMEIGFDECRNHSIKDALGNWILWIDADEELLMPLHLHKYLRKNMLNAYALQQHHMSVDPPMNLKPDLPMRLFRNNMGIRFYGVVHEHPETELNKGVGYALVLSDAWIAHDGYLTEDVRRKRFLRNIDLVIRDRKKYPDRILGKFLWLRDLVHLCRYRLEQGNGTHADPQVQQWAREAQELFRENYMENPFDPMAAEAVAYYSEANRLLGIGVPVKFMIAVEGQPPKEIVAQFESSENAAIFLSKLTKAVLSPLEGRYI